MDDDEDDDDDDDDDDDCLEFWNRNKSPLNKLVYRALRVVAASSVVGRVFSQ